MKKICTLLIILLGGSVALCNDDSTQFDILHPPETLMPVISESLIMVETWVNDKSGNFVPGLKAEDFKLYQDGKKQQITEFHEIERAIDGSEPRIIIFIIDDLGLPAKKYNQVRAAIRNFADNVMHPTDMVGIGRTAGGGVVFQPMTSDAEELRSAISQWQCGIETARPLENVILASSTSSSSFINSCSGNT